MNGSGLSLRTALPSRSSLSIRGALSIHNKVENANGAGEAESCLSAINPVWCPATICIFTALVLRGEHLGILVPPQVIKASLAPPPPVLAESCLEKPGHPTIALC